MEMPRQIFVSKALLTTPEAFLRQRGRADRHSVIHPSLMIKTAGYAFRLRSSSYGEVGYLALRAMNMLRKDANNVPFETRGFIVQVGGNSLDRIAMGHKLGLPRDARRTLCACQLIHRGITDLALHRFAAVHHRKCERQPLAIVPDNLATRQRHKNPRPFEAIMRRRSFLSTN